MHTIAIVVSYIAIATVCDHLAIFMHCISVCSYSQLYYKLIWKLGHLDNQDMHQDIAIYVHYYVQVMDLAT